MGRRQGRDGSVDRRRGTQGMQQSVPGGFYILPKAVIVPTVGGNFPGGEGEGCVDVVDKVEVASSQCGSEDWKEYFVPNFFDEFEDGCRFLHKCWGKFSFFLVLLPLSCWLRLTICPPQTATCTQTMTSCNEAVLSLLLGVCDSTVSDSSNTPSSTSSSHPTANLTACHNLAHFTHYHLSSTPHAFALYASIYSQACVIPPAAGDSIGSSTSNNCALYGGTPPVSVPGSTSNSTSSTSSSSTGEDPNYFCTGTVSHPYMTSCPINTSSTSPTKKGRTCVDLASDPSHCGRCNSSCPDGSKCINGACSSISCQGRGVRRCGDWKNSGLGSSCGGSGGSGEGNCMCAAAAAAVQSAGAAERESEEGEGEVDFCVDGAMPCKLLKECERNEQCALGSVCVVGGSCCGDGTTTKGVCVETDWCVSPGGGGGDGKRVFETSWTAVGGGDTLGKKVAAVEDRSRW